MPDKIKRTVDYYEMMAKKHASTPHGANQARVYGELAKLVGECSSLEEIQSRMAAEGYNEKPGQALYLDMLEAHRRAADEHGFDAVAAIYKKKYDEVAADFQKAYVTGWDQEASRELNKIGNVVGALNETMAAYLRLRGHHPMDPEHDKAASVIKDSAITMESNGKTFEEAVADDYYRKHVFLDDAAYAKSLDVCRAVIAGNYQPNGDEGEIKHRTKAALDAIKPKKDELKKLGADFNSQAKRVAFISIAPEHEPGPYERTKMYEAS